DRNDSVYLHVHGDETSPPGGSRVMQMQPGENYAAAADSLSSRGWADAYVVKVTGRNLCTGG
ncbi:MAG: hypothetical protein SGPRY_013192, partial [Prymnesium sp.]